MKRNAILTFFVGYCVFCFSQELNFSNKFETLKKNVPLAIINSHKDYFHVLRYNKVLHDFTIERRNKPQADITGFTPLKLDFVNADWFNYENLDYVLFQQDKSLYFIFEKVLNFKRTLYLKVIDSVTNSSAFFEIIYVEKEKNALDFNVEFKKTNDNNILIIVKQTYNNFVKKTVTLYNIGKLKVDWVKKLPLENLYTGYSDAFECNSLGDLFYALIKSQVTSYERKYVDHMQAQVPVFYYDTLALISYRERGKALINKKVLLHNFNRLNTIKLSVNDNQVVVFIHYASQKEDSRDKTVFFLNAKFSCDLKDESYNSSHALNETIKNQLTFYDGTDSKYVGDKRYEFFGSFVAGNICYYVSERKDENYYKELLVCEMDISSGDIISQTVIPRKILIFKGRTRLKNVAEAMPFFWDGNLSFSLLESPANAKRSATNFDFHRFKRENNLWNSNIVQYSLKKIGSPEKKLLYHNSDFDLVPLYYQNTEQSDMVFYLSNGKSERFAILKQNTF